MGNDSPPRLIPNFHLILQIKMSQCHTRSKMGLLNTLQIAFVDHVVREEAPQLSKETATNDKFENLGMALDICIQTCPLIQSDDDPATVGRINDKCVDLLCLIGDKTCAADGGGGNLTSKFRSRLLGVVQKAFKGFKVRRT